LVNKIGYIKSLRSVNFVVARAFLF